MISGVKVESFYSKTGNRIIIEIEVRNIWQIYNSFDPSPFPEKELEISAEQYIFDAVEELPFKTQLEMIFHLPSHTCPPEVESSLAKAVKKHFAYKTALAKTEMKRLLTRGRWDFLIGSFFLTACIVFSELLSRFEPNLTTTLFSEGLLIIGWVAMWQPVNTFLYDWWPIRKRRKIYEKIVEMDIFVRKTS
ncbi:MAG: hypothetical protein PHD41_06000 [Methanosarcinaceae archaeon]|nr:hypothetical protein [Methanosarcinaceae archaeon]MDD4332272.1 hypothetical protein [Methanosarcinaceae archaeon]